MPLRYRAPYIPRLQRMPIGRTPGPKLGRRGPVPSGAIDTRPTGDMGTDLVKLANAITQQRAQDALANQILNTQAPPRAGLVAPGVSPTTGQPNVIRPGTPTFGSAPATGGMGELQMRQQLAQSDLADQLKRAQIAEHLARAQKLTTPPREQPAKPGKPGKYVAGSGDWANDSSTDRFNQIQADTDAQYGKNAYNSLVTNLNNIQDDGQGNLVVMQPDKSDPSKMVPVPIGISTADGMRLMQRYNAARVASGQDPIYPKAYPAPQGTNPNSGQPGGSTINPFAPKTNLEVRSLPYGSYIIDPQ